jgi:type VI protein secretion system component VasK
VQADFARFFGRAADFSSALFTDNDGPILSFDFRPFSYPAGATEIVLEVNGTSYTFTPRANTSQRITWRPDAARPVRLTVRAGSDQIHRVEGEGEWGVFRIFASTTWREANNWQRVAWRIPQRSDSLVADVGLDVKPVLRPDYLRDLATCPPRILN